MSKFAPSDDGKVIDGKTVVYLYPPGTAAEGAGGPEGKKAQAGDLAGAAAAKLALAKSQAATLAAAAKDGVPFCEECEKAKQELARRAAEAQNGNAEGASGGAAAAQSAGGGAAAQSAGDDSAAAGSAADDPIHGDSSQAEEGGDEVKLTGTLKGPAGPLKGFPFQLLRDGQPVLPAKEIVTKNESRGEVWLSDAEGKYLFDKLPEGKYQVALFSPSGEVEPEPKVQKESGARAGDFEEEQPPEPYSNFYLEG